MVEALPFSRRIVKRLEKGDARPTQQTNPCPPPLDNARRLCYHIPQDYNEEADNLRFLMHFHQKMPVVRTYIA